MHEWKTGETITAELLNALEHTADDADTLSKTNESDIGDIYNRVNAVISDAPQPKLMDGSVKTETITNEAVTADKLARGSVTNAKLEAGAVANSNIRDGAVWTEKLANFAVTTTKIKDSAVTGAKIANGTITADKLAPGVGGGGGEVADGSITSAKLAFGAVETANIGNRAVTDGKIADNAVVARTIPDGTITGEKIDLNAVTGNKIADDAITSSKIEDGAVTDAKIANGAVTGAKIADGTITAAKLAPGVGGGAGGEIADASITGQKIAHMTITGGSTGNIASKTIQGMNIKDGALSDVHIAPLAVGKILNRPPAISNGTVPSTLPNLTFSGIPCYGGIDTTSSGYGYETMYPRTGIMQLHNAGAEALNIKTNTAFVVSLLGNNANVTGFKQDSTFPAIDILTGDVYTFEFPSAKSMSCTTDINIQAGQTLTLMIIEEADNLPPAQPAIGAKE